MAMNSWQPTFVTPLVPLQSARSRAALRGVVQQPAEKMAAGSSQEMPQSSALGSAALVAVAAVGVAAARRATDSRRGQTKSRVTACASATGAHCAEYKEELLSTVKALTTPGKGILAMDESNGTCGLRLQSIGVENTEDNRKRWRSALLGTNGLGEYCGGAIDRKSVV